MSPLLPPESTAARWRRRLSLAIAAWAAAGLAAVFFLISPRPDQTFPGAIEWDAGSWLRPLVETMGLWGLVQSERGVEIKDLAFHVTAVVGLLLFAVRAWVSGVAPPDRESARGAWFFAQAFFALWVLVSLASALWSQAASLSVGQSVLYAFAIAWAISLAWTLEGRDAPRLLTAYIAIAAGAALVCLWYYNERNPFHRPGFPIGNPSTLASVLLPALLIAGFVAFGWLADRLRGRDAGPAVAALAAATALLPLAAGFQLAGSRAAQVGALVGVLGVAFITTTRRVRGLVVALGLIAAGLGSYALSTSMQDVAMARGATLRFRAYAWRYAAELWSRRPVSGMGAGQYPRLATDLALRDEALDPAAFLGDVVEHAHNELFEVLAEIGLIGGLTFVAGHLASIAGASALLQSSFSPQRRWLVCGLVAAVLAMLGDGLFGVGFRLPGVPIVFFTLLGVLWAFCRASTLVRGRTGDESASGAGTRRFRRRWAVALAALTVSAGLAYGAARNWQGVQAELAGVQALERDEFAAGRDAADRAATLLLDPVRQLMNDTRAVRAQLGLGRALYEATVRMKADDSERPAAREAALDALEAAFDRAVAFDRFAPRFDRCPMFAAQAAILRAALLRETDPAEAQRLQNTAIGKWSLQRRQRPYDRSTLLSLAHFQMPLGERLGLLRDALRSGVPDETWLTMFKEALRNPQALSAIDVLVAIAQPYSPKTESNALILSAAAENYRLRANARRLRGDLVGAIEDLRAAEPLYRAMHARFPELTAVVLSEIAECQFALRPGDADEAIRTLQAAIESLPRIQPQQYDAVARPYREALVRMLLAEDRRAEADDLMRVLIPDNPEARREHRLNIYLRLMNEALRRPDAPLDRIELWFVRAVEIGPAHPRVWVCRLWLAARRGAADEQIAEAQARAAGLPPALVEAIRAAMLRLRTPTSAPSAPAESAPAVTPSESP